MLVQKCLKYSIHNSLKLETTSYILNDMVESHRHYSKWKKLEREAYAPHDFVYMKF